MICSPLNYTGGKYRLLPQILPLFPDGINTFVDLFCGGCNVGINVPAAVHLYNDVSEPLVSLLSLMGRMSADGFLKKVGEVIRAYGLSDVKTNGYGYYGCDSSSGLGSFNREPYTRLRDDFNRLTDRNDEYYIKLYVLIVFAFNNQIRFNGNGEFNLPVGKRDFNGRMAGKVRSFMTALHDQNAVFTSRDFTALDLSGLKPGDFVYADPPYLITRASYNEQGGWGEDRERQLLSLLDSLSSRGIRFALSNVLEAKGRTNEILLDWLNDRPGFRVVDLEYSYGNANYQRRHRDMKTREVLITGPQ